MKQQSQLKVLLIKANARANTASTQFDACKVELENARALLKDNSSDTHKLSLAIKRMNDTIFLLTPPP